MSDHFAGRPLPPQFRGVRTRVELDYWPRGVPLDEANKANAISTAPAPSTPERRHIVEWCCGPQSKIGSHAYTTKGCKVTRITEREDATKQSTVDTVKQLVVKP